jgi:tRNA(Arg) A34 adenosine deaminase TadA
MFISWPTLCPPTSTTVRVLGEAFLLEIAKSPTSHAEIVVMRRAGGKLRQSEFLGATPYSTLQPCGMCTMASIWAKIGRIVYRAERDQVRPMFFEDRHLDTMDFVRLRRSFPHRWAACRRARGALCGSRRGGAAGRAVQPLTSASRGGRCILRAISTSTISNSTLSYPPAEIIVSRTPHTGVKRWGLSFSWLFWSFYSVEAVSIMVPHIITMEAASACCC